jgi:hypothetical protein
MAAPLFSGLYQPFRDLLTIGLLQRKMMDASKQHYIVANLDSPAQVV